MNLLEASRITDKYRSAGFAVSFTTNMSGDGYVIQARRAKGDSALPIHVYTEGQLALLIASGQVAERFKDPLPLR